MLFLAILAYLFLSLYTLSLRFGLCVWTHIPLSLPFSVPFSLCLSCLCLSQYLSKKDTLFLFSYCSRESLMKKFAYNVLSSMSQILQFIVLVHKLQNVIQILMSFYTVDLHLIQICIFCMTYGSNCLKLFRKLIYIKFYFYYF